MNIIYIEESIVLRLKASLRKRRLFKEKIQINKGLIYSIPLFLFLIGNCSANPIVYGYWPENGVEPADYQPDWPNLTHVAFASWMMYPDGSADFRQIKLDKYATIRDQAHAHGVKIILSTACDTPEIMDSILAYHQDDFVNNFYNYMIKYNADGVDLDWEEPYEKNSYTGQDNKVLMESLLKKLHAKLHPTYFIGIDTYDYPLYVYQNPDLIQYIDALFIMDYDMGLTSGVTMSNSPMYCEDRLDYPKSITAANEFGFPNDKIILGMPFYGYDFVTNSNKAGSPYFSVTMKDIKVAILEASKYGRNWDSSAQTPWYAYQSGSTWHQVWYDDSESLSIKYNFAKSKNLAGVGFWALGKENTNILALFSNGGQINTDPVKVAPVTSLSASPTNGNAPLTVTFTDTSTGSPTTWKWSFGDGTYSTEQNPKHTYATSGTYTVKLTASNEAGTSTNTKTNFINVSAFKKPVVSFGVSTRSGYAPLTVTFTDTSTNSPDAWKWSFGDGTYSTVKNPKHTYATAGTYTVKLTASNEAGTSTNTKTNYIKVTALQKPDANFWGSTRSGYAPLTVSFTDASTGSPTAWKWSFGDGTYSTVKNPKHKYLKAGTYTVKLTASNKAGSETMTKTSYIKVNNPRSRA